MGIEMKLKVIRLLILSMAVVLLVACGGNESSSTPTPNPGIPDTSASAITSPPVSMDGIQMETV